MKKILLVALVVTLGIAGLVINFLLPGEELSPTTVQAQELINDNKVEEAYELLLTNEETLDSTGADILGELKTQLYAIYVKDAQEAYSNKEYIVAYELYQKIVTIAPDEDMAKIKENIKELETTVASITALQDAYKEYMVTFEQALNESNLLLKDFKAALDKLEVGLMSPEEFSKLFKARIDVSNNILNTLDTALSVNNTDLLSIHREVVTMMNEQHNMILASLQITPEQKTSSVASFKSTYLNIKEKQIAMVQRLNAFAVTNNIETVTISDPNKKEEETAATDNNTPKEEDSNNEEKKPEEPSVKSEE